MTSFDVEEFNLAGVLTVLAAEDMNQAIQLTEGFTNEAAHASGVIAVARSVLAKGRCRQRYRAWRDGRSSPCALPVGTLALRGGRGLCRYGVAAL